MGDEQVDEMVMEVADRIDERMAAYLEELNKRHEKVDPEKVMELIGEPIYEELNDAQLRVLAKAKVQELILETIELAAPETLEEGLGMSLNDFQDNGKPNS